MRKMQKLEFRHPLWLAITGWCFLPVMFIGSFWIMALPVIHQNYELLAFAPSLVLGLPCAYMSFNALLTLPYMFATIEATDEGLNVKLKAESRFVRWADVSKVRHVVTVQTIHLYDNNGNRFLSFTEQVMGYNMLSGLLNDKANGTL